MRLGIIADTRHHLDGDGRPCTLESVALQLERVAALFEEVVLLVPVWPGPPPAGFRPYRFDNVLVRAVHQGGGASLRAKARLAFRAVEWSVAIARLLPDVDAVHLRCPCNIGALGILGARVARLPRWAMYAGNWSGYPDEPWSYRAQRALLRRPAFGDLVTVYAGAGMPGTPHIVPFFSPTFTAAEWDAEAPVVEAKVAALRSGTQVRRPLRLVTVGNLEPNKRHAAVIQAVGILRDRGVDAHLDVVGDGPLLGDLTALRARLGLDDAVRLLGRLALDAVRRCYREADFNVLASVSEGYPKVLVEGMVSGAVAVASPFPAVDALLGDGVRGTVFASGTAAGLADTLSVLADDPGRMAAMVSDARAYAATVTLDAFEARLRELLERHWRVPVGVHAEALRP